MSSGTLEPLPPRTPGGEGSETAAFGSTFSHLISVETNNYDSDCNPWLTPDEKEIFFIRAAGQYGPPDAGHQGSWDIYHADWDSVAGGWGPVTNLGPNVNTPGAERRPTTTADGDTLLFAGSGIRYSIRTAGEFGPSTVLFSGSDPCLSHDGRKLYFVRTSDIWTADRGPSGNIDDWVNLQPIGPPVNSTHSEVRPYVSRDDSLLFFSDFGGERPGGYGGADLWVSAWTGTGWGAPQNVGPPINVDRPACTPWLSADGLRLYASSESFEGSRGCEDVWIAHRDSLPPPAPVNPSPGTWTKLGELNGAWNVYDLAEGTDGTLYAATSPGGAVFRSEDDGATWTETADLPGASIAHSLLMASDGALYAGTYPEGRVFRTSDGGATWVATAALPVASAVRALLETSDGRILAGTSPLCRIFATSDGGSSWTSLATPFGMNSSVTVLYEMGDGSLLAGGWGQAGAAQKSTDGGTTWSPILVSSGMASVESFREASDGTLWMTGWEHGGGGFVEKSTDGGLTWTATSTVTVDSLSAVRVYDIVEPAPGEVLVGFQPGPERVACLSPDGGATWQTEGTLAGAHEILRFLELGDGTILAATTPSGDVFRYTPGAGTDAPLPEEGPGIGVAAVLGGAPNPFRTGTRIAYQVPREERIHLSVVDVTGRSVRTLVDRRVPAGRHEAPWSGEDASGNPVASGVYFVRLAAGGSVTFQKVVLAR